MTEETEQTQEKARPTKVEFALWSLAFLDMLGFGMLIPDIQLRLDGMHVPGELIGLILASMFIVQVVVSPLWGRLSDRTGRKPIIVACTALSALSMLIYGLAQAPLLIGLSRVVAGLGAANIAIAQAYVRDLSAKGSLVVGMGRIGAAISAGLVAGPALGGFLAARLGSHWVGYVAAALSALGALLAFVMLPTVAVSELTEEKKKPGSILREVPGLARVFIVIAVGWFSLATLEGTFGRLLKYNLGLGPDAFGIVFSYESLLGLGVQAFLVGHVTKRHNTATALRWSYLFMGLGLGAFPLAPTFALILVASTVYAVSSGLANPLANAAASEVTPESKQGELFGLVQAARSFGFIVGPMLGGKLFDRSPAAPYFLAMGVCAAAALAVPKVIVKPS